MSWSNVKENVADNGGVHTVTMEQLRDAAGKDKLGVHVRDEIKSSLAQMGLGHVPKELPKNQHEQVRLYSRGTAIGDFIDTVLSPGGQNDIKLKESLSEESSKYQSIIEQVRELVGD
jgi:hypothetical protein